jgi:methyl-accepting chemotaxis protein
MQPKKYRRKFRSYFINKQIQLRLAISNLMYMILVVSVVILTVLAPFYLDIFQPSELCRQYLSAKIFLVLLERLVIAVGVLLLVAFVHQIVLSHKFCGPLVNFVNSFKKLSTGDLTRRIYLRRNFVNSFKKLSTGDLTRRIYLRRYDFLKDEARHLNEMIDGLSNKIVDIKKENNKLVSSLEEAMDASVNQEANSDALGAAKKHADTCREMLSKFKLSEEFNEK